MINRTYTTTSIDLNIPVNQLSNEMQLILNVYRSFCKQELIRPYQELLNDKLHWDEVIHLANHHSLMPILFHIISKLSHNGEVPEKVLTNLRGRHHQTIAFNMQLFRILNLILDAFNDHGLSVILLKGPAFIAEKFYPNIALRQMSDIDLLIRKKDADVADKVLQGLGYRCEPVRQWLLREYYCLEYYHFTNPRVEVHWELFMPEDFQQNWNGLPSEVLWKYIQSLTVDNRSVLALSDEMNLLYTCLHMAKHYLHGETRLIWFCDISLIVRQKGESLNWPLFWQLADSVGMKQLVSETLHLVNLPLIGKGTTPVELISSGHTFDYVHSIKLIKRIMSIPGFKLKVSSFLDYFFPSLQVLSWKYAVRSRGKLYLMRLIHPIFLLWRGLTEVTKKGLMKSRRESH